MNNEFIPSWTYRYDLDRNRGSYLKLINKVFDSGRLLFGEELLTLERNFSSYIGVNHSIGCDNATNGIFLSLKALGISAGDKVLTVANTAIPTVSAIRQSGATPCFIDINEFGLIDDSSLEKILCKEIKAIIVVHLFGFPCNMKSIMLLSNKYNIPIIEDCSQAHGATLDGRKVGSFGDLSVFSFYPTKPLGGFGDAGIICTNDSKKNEKLKRLRFYGINSNYIAEEDGYNSRMDEIQAALINYKLKNLDSNIKDRNKIYNLYHKYIDSSIIKPLPRPSNCICSNYLVPFIISHDRDKFAEILKINGVGTNISYSTPIHLMPAYKSLGYRVNSLPNTELLCKSIISFPIFDYMPIKICYEIIDKINKVIKLL